MKTKPLLTSGDMSVNNNGDDPTVCMASLAAQAWLHSLVPPQGRVNFFCPAPMALKSLKGSPGKHWTSLPALLSTGAAWNPQNRGFHTQWSERGVPSQHSRVPSAHM